MSIASGTRLRFAQPKTMPFRLPILIKIAF
jgi:hypothetical protein